MSITTASTTYDRLVEVLIDLGLSREQITPEAGLRTDLEVDSAELVEVVAKVAPEGVDGKALKSVRTLADLAQFLDRLS